jgi:hypothetical protein
MAALSSAVARVYPYLAAAVANSARSSGVGGCVCPMIGRPISWKNRPIRAVVMTSSIAGWSDTLRWACGVASPDRRVHRTIAVPMRRGRIRPRSRFGPAGVVVDFAGLMPAGSTGLHVVLAHLVPGGAARNLTAAHAADLLRGLRVRDPAAKSLRALATDLTSEVRQLDRRIAKAADDIRTAVTASGTALTDLCGVGTLTAVSPLEAPM